MVPMLTWGLVLWNFAFATSCPPGLLVLIKAVLMFSVLPRWVTGPGYSWLTFTRPSPSPCALLGSSLVGLHLLARRLCDDLLRHVGRHFGIRVEHHGVVRPALRLGP